ncbi:DNA repair exonuclease [Thermoplasmatales archaeon BRNA1]|nr:DNA repair exonuclease [Thermoplasmatales archaeon BRNA1]
MGCNFTFVHAADLHLGSRFWGISLKDPDLGKRLFESTFESFRRIIDLTKEKADFLVISGDAFDESTMTLRTKLRFCEEIKRLGTKPVFLVKGNHDFGDSWADSIPFPSNVHLLRDSPQSMTLNFRNETVEIVGMSYGTQHTSENIASKLSGNPDAFTIAVLHCSVSDVAESGDYAPCSVSDMLGKNIDYWALGHIHKRMVLRESSPCIVYPGNIQGRSPKETGEKGCYLVSVKDGNVEKEFVPTQSVIWQDIEADITGIASADALIGRVRQMSRPGSIISLTYVGRGPLDRTVRADPQGIADQISSLTGCPVSVRGIETRPDIDLDAERNGATLVSEIIRTADMYSGKSGEELLRVLLECRPAAEVRNYLAWFAESGKLNALVKEAEMDAIDRVTGGSR